MSRFLLYHMVDMAKRLKERTETSAITVPDSEPESQAKTHPESKSSEAFTTESTIPKIESQIKTHSESKSSEASTSESPTPKIVVTRPDSAPKSQTNRHPALMDPSMLTPKPPAQRKSKRPRFLKSKVRNQPKTEEPDAVSTTGSKKTVETVKGFTGAHPSPRMYSLMGHQSL